MTIDSADDSKNSNRTIDTNRISNRTYDSKSNRITKLRRSLGQTSTSWRLLTSSRWRSLNFCLLQFRVLVQLHSAEDSKLRETVLVRAGHPMGLNDSNEKFWVVRILQFYLFRHPSRRLRRSPNPWTVQSSGHITRTSSLKSIIGTFYKSRSPQQNWVLYVLLVNRRVTNNAEWTISLKIFWGRMKAYRAGSVI